MNSPIVLGERKECCLQPDNLERQRPRYDQIIDTCKVCGKRHIRILFDLTSLQSVPTIQK